MYPFHFFRYTLAAAILFLVASSAPAQLKPVSPSTDEQNALADEGLALMEGGKHDLAIAKFEELLKSQSDNIDALYGLASSYFEKKEFRKSLEYASRAAEYESDYLQSLYTILGSNFDMLRQPEQAIEAYRKGIVLFPDSYLLHYNLGITMISTKLYSEAAASFKRSIELEPRHPASHFGLANVYLQLGYRVPALLAVTRFLILEPASKRSEAALILVDGLLNAGLSPSKELDEGEFKGSELALGDGTGELKGMQDRIGRFTALVDALAREADGGGFARGYYLPYFTELQKKGDLSPFIHHIYQGSTLAGVKEWLAKNDSRVKEFLAWSDGYVWPGGK